MLDNLDLERFVDSEWLDDLVTIGVAIKIGGNRIDPSDVFRDADEPKTDA